MKPAGVISSAFVAGVASTASCPADFFSAVESESFLREEGFLVKPGGEFFSSVGLIVRGKGATSGWVVSEGTDGIVGWYIYGGHWEEGPR